MRLSVALSLAASCSPLGPPSFSCPSYSAFCTEKCRRPKERNRTIQYPHPSFCPHRLMLKELSMNSNESTHNEGSEIRHKGEQPVVPPAPAISAANRRLAYPGQAAA